jgi:hypothetical protein
MLDVIAKFAEPALILGLFTRIIAHFGSYQAMPASAIGLPIRKDF